MKRLPLFLAVVIAAAGCRVEGFQFREDNSIEIVGPTDRATVQLPIILRWRADPGQRFGVFVDVVPPPPGKGLDYLFRKDPRCRPAKSCVVPDYLATRGIWRTAETTFTIETIGQRVGVPKDQRDWHEATIALLDERGRRVGEKGDWVLLKLKR